MTLDAATRAAINAAASKAAKAAIKEAFLTLGIDASTPAEIRELQQDLVHLRTMRVARGSRGKYWVTVFSVAMTAAGSVLTMAIQHVFFGGHTP
jgi:hypothetical protein